MSDTKEFFAATKGQPVRVKTGALKLHQAVEMMDALAGVYVVCHRVMHEFAMAQGRDFESMMSGVHGRTLETVRQSRMSVAQCQKLLIVWYKWTHQHCEEVPNATSVLNFLHDDSIAFTR